MPRNANGSRARYFTKAPMAKAQIVGHSDRLGYLRCVECHVERGAVSDHVVYSDSGWSDVCDCCGKTVGAVPREVWACV